MHRETISRTAIDDRCGENLRETMSDELKTRLLVVDDEQSIRRLCMTIGNSLNFACAEAESAEAALARLDAEIPDLVLTDLKLPTQSGVELLRQISKYPRCAAHDSAPERYAYTSINFRRKRHRQGIGSPSDSFSRHHGANSICGRRLRFASAYAHGKRTLRLRKRRLHRSHKNESRSLSSCQRRHDFPR